MGIKTEVLAIEVIAPKTAQHQKLALVVSSRAVGRHGAPISNKGMH